MLRLSRSESFPAGGQITVLPGVTGNSSSVLSGTSEFKISPGGKKVEPL